jgi:hypothetical protein
MLVARSTTARPWIALAAFVGALLIGADGATAACTSMATTRACEPACGCCEPQSPASGQDHIGGTASVHRHVPSPTTGRCEDAPTGGCSCRSGRPDAPGPKPGQRTPAERTDPAPGLTAWAAFDPASQRLAPHVPPGSSPPQKSPLYLRTSRLLI